VVRHLFGCGRYEWYQTTSLVVVYILAKAAEEEDLKVHFSELGTLYVPSSIYSQTLILFLK
jgi:hypothetical protein